jgi:hypothetical protein
VPLGTLENCNSCGDVCPDGSLCFDNGGIYECTCEVGSPCYSNDKLTDCCSGTEECGDGGVCKCPLGTDDCNQDGTCEDLSTNKNYCGSCENSCPNDVICQNGICTCPEDTTACGDISDCCKASEVCCGETCADLQTDERYCGSCTNTCDAGQTCLAGVCSSQTCSQDGDCLQPDNQCKRAYCYDGECFIGDKSDGTSCDDGNPCTDNHCLYGSCIANNLDGTACDDGNACTENDVCAAGVCQAGQLKSCPEGDDCCGGTCTDLQTDPNHCGSCSNGCLEEQECCDGDCSGTDENCNHCGDVCPEGTSCGYVGLASYHCLFDCGDMSCIDGLQECCNDACAPIGTCEEHCDPPCTDVEECCGDECCPTDSECLYDEMEKLSCCPSSQVYGDEMIYCCPADTTCVREEFASECCPVVEAGSDFEVCLGSGTKLLDGTPEGGIWSGPGVTGNSFDPSTAGEGEHTLTYRYAEAESLCDISDTLTAKVLASPQAAASSNSPVCAGGDITLTGAPDGMSYSWTGPMGFLSSQQNPTVSHATESMEGTYYLTVSGSNDCTGEVATDVVVETCAPTCSDSIVNGQETDVDCGGGDCLDCADGKACIVGSDCLSGVCDVSVRTCTPATCSDGVKNGAETDIDCGGDTCISCANEKECLVNSDCVSAECRDGICSCPEPLSDCSGECVDKNSDPMNCESCGNKCPGVNNGIAACSSGSCTFNCNADYANCDGNAANGCEVNTKTNHANCGACGQSCSDWQECAEGSCTPAECVPTTATISSNSPLCEGSELHLQGGPNDMFSYSWMGPGGWTSADQNPTRTPAVAGEYTLTIKATHDGCEGTKSTTVEVLGEPSVDAGQNDEACIGGSVHLQGIANNCASVSWSGGTGVFDNPSSPETDYSLGAGDISTVTLTLRGNPQSPCMTTDADTVDIAVQAPPRVDAGTVGPVNSGEPATLHGTAQNCQTVAWSGGFGTFSDPNSLDTDYTPGPADGQSVVLTLTGSPISPCTTPVSDQLTINFLPPPVCASPTVYAGSYDPVCPGDMIALHGVATNYQTVTWSDGSGTFADSLDVMYTVGLEETGSIDLTLTATPKNNCGKTVSDTAEIDVRSDCQKATCPTWCPPWAPCLNGECQLPKWLCIPELDRCFDTQGWEFIPGFIQGDIQNYIFYKPPPCDSWCPPYASCLNGECQLPKWLCIPELDRCFDTQGWEFIPGFIQGETLNYMFYKPSTCESWCPPYASCSNGQCQLPQWLCIPELDRCYQTTGWTMIPGYRQNNANIFHISRRAGSSYPICIFGANRRRFQAHYIGRRA